MASDDEVKLITLLLCVILCRFGEYDLHDLVELDHQTVGVMIQADAETCQILTNRNAVRCPSYAEVKLFLWVCLSHCCCQVVLLSRPD